jgi:hypothetical protein
VRLSATRNGDHMHKTRDWLGYRTRAHLWHALYLIDNARPVLGRLRAHRRLWALEWGARAGNRWSTP